MSISSDKIRNIAVVGHQTSGKTSLVESLLFKANVISKKGSIDKKNTVSDFLDEEKKKQSSIQSSIVSFNHLDHEFNIIDVPGNDDYIYEMLSVTKLIKGAILVIDANKGVQVGTIKAFNQLKKRGVPIFIFINKMDSNNVNFDLLYEDIKSNLDEKKCVPFAYPLGKKDTFDGFVNLVELKARIYDGNKCNDGEIYEDKRQKVFELHNRLCESVATTNDEMLEKFFSNQKLSLEEIKTGLRQGVLNGELYPILVGSALKDIGVNTLLNMFIDFFPKPTDLKPIIAKDDKGNNIEIKTIDTEPMSLQIFKMSNNQYQGIISVFKVNSGVIKVGDEVYCPNISKSFKINYLYKLLGDKLTQVKEIHAGDIGAISKIDELRLGYTLSSNDRKVIFDLIKYPTVTYFRGIVPKTKNDSDKLFQIVEKLMIEDPCIEISKNNYTNQILIGGLSSTHLNYIFEKLKDNYNIKFDIEQPKISYRETITKKGSAEGRYIKQSGGSGYYGVVNMEFEPSNETCFNETVFGGHIDKGYFSAVEKGFKEALEKGDLTSSPVINVKATLTDGKQHSVDSNELAFKNAAIAAFRNAYKSLDPIVLEPYDKLVISCPSEYLGLVLSDLTKRRGRIISTIEENNNVEIIALAPEVEIIEYANDIKSITKSTGYFNKTFEKYEMVPKSLSDKLIQQLKDNK